MSENCNQDCSSCLQDCAERKEPTTDFIEKPHALSHVKHVIGVVSGKGGVGKSLVTSILAVAMNKRGFQTAILDADITGPSIPKAFGVKEKAKGNDLGIFPARTADGIKLMSINLLMEDESDPVIWRGPIIAGTVKQFWSDVMWGEVDFMFIDMPPGTGDVPLTVFQSIPVDGILVVTSPQELVSMIVSKAVTMAEMMNVPIIGLVENFSYFRCPDNGKDYQIFGESHIEEIATKHHLKVLAKIPVDPKISEASDQGAIESYEGEWIVPVANTLEKMERKMIKIAVASDHGKVATHFGHCLDFAIFEAKDQNIIKSQILPNPGHKPGFLPNYLNDLGVDVIISGGMGGGAVQIFNEKGIEVVVGASGDVREAADQYLKGQLRSTGEVCHEHERIVDCTE